MERPLVIIVGGTGVAESGPYKGERTLLPTEVFVHGQKVSMVSHIVYKQGPNQPVPDLHFTFSDLDPKIVQSHDAIRQIYEKYVHLVHDGLPWASYTSPLGDRTPKAITVFDPGDVKPTTPA